METVLLLNKFLHLFSISALVGGSLLVWVVAFPAAKEAGEAAIASLFKRYGRAMVLLWVLVFATGFYNLLQVWPKTTKGYHHLLEGKVLCSLLMAAASTMMSHPSFAANLPTERKLRLLAVVVILGAAAIGLSAQLNISRVNGTGLLNPAP